MLAQPARKISLPDKNEAAELALDVPKSRPANKVAAIAEEDNESEANKVRIGTDTKTEEEQEEEEQLKEGEIPERAKNCCLYRVCYQICVSNGFNFAMVAAIVFNTGLLSLDRYPISFELASTYESINEALSWIFFGEMLVKVIGLGPRVYVQDSFNVFDGVVVLISIVEIAIKRAGVSLGGGGAFSGLRAIRLLRVFKLARSWTSFRELLAKMIVTLGDISHFSVLMLLFMFIQTLLGMELFAFKVKFNNSDKESVVAPDKDGVYPRVNFNGVLNGFTTIFIVFLGEDWNAPMYDHTRALGFGCVIYFIQLFIMGNIILLNLFLAILLENFEEPPAKEEEDVAETADGKTTKISILDKMKGFFCYCCYAPTETPVAESQPAPATVQRAFQVAPL